MLAFVRKNQVLLTSFFCLLFSLYILSAASTGRLRGDPVGPLLLELTRPFEIGAQATVTRLRDIPQRLATLRSLTAENTRLKQRVVELEAERNHLLEAGATNRQLRDLLALRSQLPSGSVASTVIGNSASSWFHSFILDKGSADGVFKGMAVVSPAGAIGQVVAVASRSSKVLLITDPHSGVDVIDQRSRARGIVAGSLDSGPILKYAKRSEDIRPGDRLITSGLDNVFPAGVLVGTATQVRKKTFGLFQYVEVALAVDFSEVEEVLVVSAGTTQPEP